MRSILVFALVLCLAYGQYHQGSRPQGTVAHGRPASTPYGGQPVSRGPQVAPGSSYQVPPEDETSKVVESFITMFFEQFKNLHIDRYETEDGVLTNLNVKVSQPTRGNLMFRYSEKEDRLYFLLRGVSASIDSDINVMNGAAKGHLALSVQNIDIELRTDSAKLGGKDAMHIDYRLHLKDAEIKADLTALKDENMPGFNQIAPMLNNNQGASYKIMTTNVLDDVFRHNSVEEVKEFLSRMPHGY